MLSHVYIQGIINLEAIRGNETKFAIPFDCMHKNIVIHVLVLYSSEGHSSKET